PCNLNQPLNCNDLISPASLLSALLPQYTGHAFDMKRPETSMMKQELAVVSFLRRTAAHFTFFAAVLLVVSPLATGMDFVKLSPDKKGFVLDPSGDRYVPWGHNYGSVDIMERLTKDPKRVEREFAEMKAAGTTVARVHPEMPAFFDGPHKANAEALERLRQLLAIAEKSGIYLQITGLACYKINNRMAWYDALQDEDRWKAQEFFWSAVAEACAKSS